MTTKQIDLPSIFMPRAMKELERFKSSDKLDFVHYTSAENFMRIFDRSDPAIWMRNAQCMNDLSEIKHGRDRIAKALDKDDRLQRLTKALNECHNGLGEQSFELFNKSLSSFLTETYITCVSAHHKSEDNIGRLSMWRAYGQGSIGVAIVLNKDSLFSETNYLPAFSSPVSYIDDDEVGNDIEEIIASIDANRDGLRNTNFDTIKMYVFTMLKFGVICLKHSGFLEEQEWRIIHNPQKAGPTLNTDTVSLSGVPQKIYKIAFKDYSTYLKPYDISPNKIVKRVIIGPSNYAGVIRDAIIDTLAKAKVENPSDRVVVSDIPLRTLI